MKWVVLALFFVAGTISANAAEPEGFEEVVTTTCGTGDLGKARLIRAAILSEESERLLKAAEGWETRADQIEELVKSRQLYPNEVERLEYFCQELRSSAAVLSQESEDLSELGIGVMLTSLAVPDDLDEEACLTKCQEEFQPVKDALEKAWWEERAREKHLAPLFEDYRTMEQRLNSAYLKGQTPLQNFSNPIRYHHAKYAR